MNKEQRDLNNKRTTKFGCATIAGIVLLIPILSQINYMFREEALVNAARAGDIATVDRLLNWGANINAVRDNSGGTALISASAEGHTNVVELLIRRGANVNQAEEYTVIKPQIRRGANVDPTEEYFVGDTKIRTPLQVSVGHPEIIAMLKKAGAVE